MLTVGIDIPADRSFKSYQNPDNFKSWYVPVTLRANKNLEDTMLPVNYWSWQRSFLSYPKIEDPMFPVNCYWVDNRSFRRCLRKLKGVCFSSTVRVDSRSFQSYCWKEIYY